MLLDYQEHFLMSWHPGTGTYSGNMILHESKGLLYYLPFTNIRLCVTRTGFEVYVCDTYSGLRAVWMRCEPYHRGWMMTDDTGCEGPHVKTTNRNRNSRILGPWVGCIFSITESLFSLHFMSHISIYTWVYQTNNNIRFQSCVFIQSIYPIDSY